ncbi:hypothetical protein [Legionella oakridgensis]|uniref:hypothetical protein n=1 Tax=Legionella oakridgensis TaxID=29423 RepID=UPI00072EFEBF|nr:hypothetical protein [Legionella oakridgensis]
MRIVDELLGLVSSKLEMIKTIIAIMKLETRLARLSVFPLLLNLCMLFVVLITLWWTAMCMLGYSVHLLYNNTIIAISSVLFLNLIVFILLLKYLQFNVKNMGFTKTREILFQHKDGHHHERPQTNHSDDNRAGSKISATTD